MIKNKTVQWILSTWIIQSLMRLFTGGWCFVRKSDKRFTVGEPLSYKGDRSVAPGKHRRSKWDMYLCIQVPWNSTYPVHIVFDVYTDQRLALLGKSFRPGDLIGLKVGYEDGKVLFVSRSGVRPLPPKFIKGWNGAPADFYSKENWEEIANDRCLNEGAEESRITFI